MIIWFYNKSINNLKPFKKNYSTHKEAALKFIELVKKENTVIKDSVSSQFKTLNKLPILKIELDSVALLKENNKLFYKEENIKLQHHPINDYNFF